MICLGHGSATTDQRRLTATPLLSAALLMFGAAQAGLAQSADNALGDAEWGAYLASECVVCHQPSGGTPGIPQISALGAEAFLAAMEAYKQRIRPHSGMQLVAARLSGDEIAALAAYFASLPPKGDSTEGSRP
jgi:cytochrome c553